MAPVKQLEAHRLMAEILKTINQLELNQLMHPTAGNQATALTDHSFTNPTTTAVTWVQLSQQKVNVAKELLKRETDLDTLAYEIDKLAVRVSLGEPDYGVIDKSSSILYYTHADSFFRPPAMEAWEDLLKLQDCMKIHTTNAANYHMFHAEVQQRKKAMENFRKVADHRLNHLILTGRPEDHDKLKEHIKDAMQALNIQTARVHYLTQKAPTVIPVHKRITPTRSPQPAVAVANHKNRELVFLKDEDLILEDTTDDLIWRVRIKNGNTSLVPALLVLIPGPDYDALNAAKDLVNGLMDQWTWCLLNMGCLLLECLRRILTKWHAKEVNYDSLDKTQAELLAKILKHSKEVIKMWKGTPIHNDITKLIDYASKKSNTIFLLSEEAHRKNLDKMLTLSKNDVSNYGDEIVYYAQLTGYYQDLEESWRRFRMLLNLGTDNDFSNAAQILAHLQQNFDPDQMVEHTVETAETEDVTRSEQQQSQRLVISAITDPRDGSELGLDDAIAKGVLDMENGLYINPRNKETKSIQEAMNDGLIQVTHQTIELGEERISTFGLIKLTTLRENRPYTITAVVDPKTDKVINPAQAHAKGILNRTSTEYHDTALDIKMSILDAVDVGLVHVEFKDNGQDHHQEITEQKTYAVHGVVDRQSKRRLSFAMAVESGILDKDKGVYVDSVSGTEMFIGEAIQKGFIKARRIKADSGLNIDPDNTMVVEKAGKVWNKLKAVHALGGLKK